jgi:class I fructose-bisphosphate aldolase
MRACVGLDIRLSRVFGGDGRSFVVALDHGFIMGPIRGIENVEETVGRVMRANPDALQVTPPLVSLLRENFLGRGAPGLVVRLDASNVWRSKPSPRTGYYAQAFTVRDAVRVGADAVVTYFLVGYGDDGVEGRNLEALGRVASEASDYGIPLVIEPLGVELGSHVVRDPEIIALVGRIASELGADILKIDYTGSRETFTKVLRSFTAPALVRGGPRSDSPESFLEMLSEAMGAGARGATVGRNLWQHPNVEAMGRAVRMIVHGEGTLDEARALLKRT